MYLRNYHQVCTMITRYKKTFVVIGTTLISSPLSFIVYYGNLLPYIASFYHAHRNDGSIYVDPLWPASIFTIAFVISMSLTSPIEFRFGIRRCLIGGDMILLGSLLSGYFSVKDPLTFTLIFGGVQGAAVGVLYSLPMKIMLQTMQSQSGISAALMSLSMIFGALISIGVSYIIINPGNKKPDLKVDNNLYFSDEDLIERTPLYFFVAGVVFGVLALCGTLLIHLGSSDVSLKSGDQNADDSLSIHRKMHGDQDNSGNAVVSDNLKESTHLCDKKSQQEETVVETERSNYSLIKAPMSSKNKCEYVNPNGSAEVSPLEAIKTRKFWLIWLGYVSSHHTNYVQLNLYKQYGEHAMANDAVLVSTGLISNAGNIIVSVLAGMAIDKYGVRNLNIAVNVVSCIVMNLMVVVIHTFPWMYMVSVVIENFVIFPHTMLFSLLTASEFGNIHCASNMGLIRTGNILLLILEPFLIENLVRYIGWDWVFLSGSLSSAIAAMAILSLHYL